MVMITTLFDWLHQGNYEISKVRILIGQGWALNC